MTQDRTAELFSDVCDIVWRAQMAERGIEVTDEFRHTSNVARQVARSIFETLDVERLVRIEETVTGLVADMEPDGSNPWWADVLLEALGVWNVPDGLPPPDDLPEVLHRLWAETSSDHGGDEEKFREHLQRMYDYMAGSHDHDEEEGDT